MSTAVLYLVAILLIVMPMVALFTMSEAPKGTQSDSEKKSIRKHARTWELWTGGRFEKMDNPIAEMSLQEYMRSDWSEPGETKLPEIKDYTARSNPVTGDYEILSGVSHVS